MDRLFRIALAFPSQLHPAKAGPPLARLSVPAGKVMTAESDAVRCAVSRDARPAAAYATAIPAELPDLVVVPRDQLSREAHAVSGLLVEEQPPRMLLRACSGLETARTHSGTLSVVAAYGRPFAVALDARYLLDALSHGPPRSPWRRGHRLGMAAIAAARANWEGQ